MESSLRKKLAEVSITSQEEDKPKATKKDVYSFLLVGVIWSVFYLLIPLIVWLFNRDWIVTLSLCGKIGIGLIAVSLFLLAGRDKLVSATATRYVPTGRSSADERVLESEREAARESLVLRIFAPIGVWMLLWGLIFVIPFAFGIPFIMS